MSGKSNVENEKCDTRRSESEFHSMRGMKNAWKRTSTAFVPVHMVSQGMWHHRETSSLDVGTKVSVSSPAIVLNLYILNLENLLG